MKKNIFLIGILFLLTGCIYEEMDVPDICGLYRGTRSYTHISNEEVCLDIMEISKDGLSGKITYSNEKYCYITSFSGDWSETDKGVEFIFHEKKVLYRSHQNLTTTRLYYKGKIKRGKMSGRTSYSGNFLYSYLFSLQEVESELDTPGTQVNVDNDI